MKWLAFILLLFPALIHGQGLSLPFNSSGKIEFDSVLKVKSNSGELYHRAKNFAAHEFVSYKTLRDDTSATANQWIIQTRIPSVVVSMLTPDSYVTFILAIQTDRDRYRYTLTDFIFNMKTVTDTLFTQPMEVKEIKIMSRKKWEEAHALLAAQIKSMTDRLHDYMTGKRNDAF